MLLNEKQILQRLVDPDERNRLTVSPIIDVREQLQPSSLDVRLGTDFVMVRTARFLFLNILKSPEEAEKEAAEYVERIHVPPSQRFVIHPGEFALGCTLEYIKLPCNLAARLEGKSTWGRVGLQVHSTAGFVDPGFEGCLTFELQNVGKVPIPLYPGIRVAQLCFLECTSTAIPYMSKSTSNYGGRAGLLTSRYFKMPDLAILRRIVDPSNDDF
jgi:dCTP deaminase